MATEAEMIRQQLTELDQETQDIRGMCNTLDDIEEKIEANLAAKRKLKKKLLDLGYKL